MAATFRNIRGQYANPPNRQELIGEISGDQRPGGPGGGPFLTTWGGSMLWANGGSPLNPMAFPGYENLYVGSPTVYRWVLQHPIVRLIRSIDIGIIGASEWEYEKTDKSAPDSWVELVQNNLDPLRDYLIREFMARGRDYGWMSGELIWRARNGTIWLENVKSLTIDNTEILRDDYGNFTGLRNNVKIKDKQRVELSAPYKAWKYTFDGESGYVYGRSWIENFRMTAWRGWLDCAQQLQKIKAKISGTVTVITSPAGNFPGPPDAQGKPTSVTYQSNAEKVIDALANSAAGAWFPTISLSTDARGNVDAMKLLVEVFGKSMTNIDVKDFGSHAPAIAGILEEMRHYEELMFAGGLRSPRTGMEGKHGTKSEVQEHTDTGTLNAEMDSRDFAGQCQPLVDAILVVNTDAGENARGKVRIKPPSLIDRKEQILKSILLSMLNDPPIAIQVAKCVDMNKLMDILGVKRIADFDGEQLQQPSANAQLLGSPGNPDKQGGRPPK